MIFARVMDGGAKFLPGFYSQFNAVSIRGAVTPLLNAMRILCSEALAHASVAEVEDLQAAHDGFKQAMQVAQEKRARSVAPIQPQILRTSE